MSKKSLDWLALQNVPINQYCVLHALADASDNYGRGRLSMIYLVEELGLEFCSLISILKELAKKALVKFDPLVDISIQDPSKQVSYLLMLNRSRRV